jgi:hypothetical protein
VAVVGLGLWGLYKLGILGGSGAGSGLTTTLNLGAGGLPTATAAQLNSNIAAQNWLVNYNKTRGQDCFTGALYNANPGNALLGVGDAQTLYHMIRSQAGTWFSSGDFNGILIGFQNLCENQTDISEVAALFQTNLGMDMFGYITQNSTFGNGENETGDNFQLVQQFVQWATGLPQTGTEQ